MDRKSFLKSLALLPLATCNMKLQDLSRLVENAPTTTRLPALFVGHGSPMNALEDNAFTRSLRQLGQALQKDGKAMIEDAEIAAVVKAAGVDGDKFVATMKSFAVTSQVTQADARQKAFKVTGTPEIVVANYYKISANGAGGQKEMLDVADFLIKKLQSEK